MRALRDHGEKVVLALVVVVCAVFAYFEYVACEAEPAELADLKGYREKIGRALSTGQPSEKYAYGPAELEKLKYKETQDANLERATKKPEADIPSYVAYPLPARPYVDPNTRPLRDDELTKHDYAELLPLSDVKAEGDHGRVFVTFKPPKRLKYMDVVRVEVFRGPAADKIELAKPYGIVEFGPEEPPEGEKPGAAGAATAAEPAGAETAPDASGSSRRRASRGTLEAETPRGREREAKKTEEIPPEYADVKVFSDTHVEAKQTYHYQARMIARMTVPEGKRQEVKNAAGAVTKIIVAHMPNKNATPVSAAKPGAILFATPLTEVVSATTPASFQVRLAGTSGKIDPPGTPDYKRTKDYKASFSVNVWVTEAQAWHMKTIEVAPDEKLKGTITYKAPDAEEAKTYDFDAGYRLVELKWGETTREIEVEEQELDKDGNPMVDPKTHRPKKVKVKKQTEPIPTEVAVLENVVEKRFEEFPKRADFEGRKASLRFYAKLAAEQEARMKSKALDKDKVKSRVKEYEDRKATERAEREAAGKDADSNVKLGQ